MADEAGRELVERSEEAAHRRVGRSIPFEAGILL
jgi:hypothetical protein